jgi:hypothetical protein
MSYEPVSASRELFIPSNLNYYGLLGSQEEIDSVSIFYDDVVLWRKSKHIKFSVKEPTVMSLKLQQDLHMTKVRLL